MSLSRAVTLGAWAIGLVLATAWPAVAQEPGFPTRPLFGDTHIHTAVSLDASALGARLGPRDALRFARGQPVISNTGLLARLARPLDFAAVADHSDQMGSFQAILRGGSGALAHPLGRRWLGLLRQGRHREAGEEILAAAEAGRMPDLLAALPGSRTFSETWADTIAAAEELNQPGLFTTFIGYEWTSSGGDTIHRNVIFRDNATLASQVLPFTFQEPLGSPLETDLWDWMGRYEAETGGDVLAIPHNGNLSNGNMFPVIQPFTDRPVDAAYATERARWEPLYEVTQMKGTTEVHPLLAPEDEFAGFEIVELTPQPLHGNYARTGLRLGLQLEALYGANPYAFGLIGSTDTHTGLATIDEDRYFGEVVRDEPSPDRLRDVFIEGPDPDDPVMVWETSASGLAAVWSEFNTRASIFDAMERREVYGTTGTRMVVRFFGGFDFVPADAEAQSLPRVGYAKGVPMGGVLAPDARGRAPTFLVAALRDPEGANLDRYQIVKGWLDDQGFTHERVYDVAWSGARAPTSSGGLPAVGSTVDLETATWTNTIGTPELAAVWTDPDFDASEPAFYYGRILEIPTPRWTAYDAVRFGVEPLPGTVMELQERAFTSPIWYRPDG